MPARELYIRVQGVSSPRSCDPNVKDGWVDAFIRYGMSLSETGLSRLMTPAPKKDPVTNSNAVTSGVSCLTYGVTDERTFSVEMHITACTRREFIEKYGRLCNEVLSVGLFELKTRYLPDVYHLIYKDCTQFDEYDMRAAKYQLTLLEPHPEIRT